MIAVRTFDGFHLANIRYENTAQTLRILLPGGSEPSRWVVKLHQHINRAITVIVKRGTI